MKPRERHVNKCQGFLRFLGSEAGAVAMVNAGWLCMAARHFQKSEARLP